jgi:hypothetical protein
LTLIISCCYFLRAVLEARAKEHFVRRCDETRSTIQLRTYSFDGGEEWSTSACVPIMIAVLRCRSSRHSIHHFECRHGVCSTPLTSRDVTTPAHIGRRILPTCHKSLTPPCSDTQLLDPFYFEVWFGNGIRVSRVGPTVFSTTRTLDFRGDVGFRARALRRRTREWQKGIDGKVISTFEHPRRFQKSYE